MSLVIVTSILKVIKR